MEYVLIIAIGFVVMAILEWCDSTPPNWVWKTRRFLGRFRK